MGGISGNALSFTPALAEKQDSAPDGVLGLSPQAWHVKILNGGNQVPRTQVFIWARKARLLANVISQTSMGTAGRFKDAEPHGGGESVSESQLDEICSEYLFSLSGHFYASLAHSCKCAFTHFFLFHKDYMIWL